LDENTTSFVSSTTGGVAGWLCSFFGTKADVVVSLGSIFLWDIGFKFYLVLGLCLGLWFCNFDSLVVEYSSLYDK
jgi:hypothetical protein